MPIIQAVKSLNAGKFSPLLRARDEYVASCKTLKNFIPTVQGPLQRRAGTRYVADITGAVRLLPFVFSPIQRYLFVFYENKIDVMNGETIVKTLQTTYKAADIPNLFYTQVQDVMFLAHADYPMKKSHGQSAQTTPPISKSRTLRSKTVRIWTKTSRTRQSALRERPRRQVQTCFPQTTSGAGSTSKPWTTARRNALTRKFPPCQARQRRP